MIVKLQVPFLWFNTLVLEKNMKALRIKLYITFKNYVVCSTLWSNVKKKSLFFLLEYFP